LSIQFNTHNSLIRQEEKMKFFVIVWIVVLLIGGAAYKQARQSVPHAASAKPALNISQIINNPR